MNIYTKWVAYNGKVGITEKGEYYDMSTTVQLHKEVHQGALYYRATSSKKRYSWKKCNKTKEAKKEIIIILPF